jgi:hypothetical protein
MFDYLSEIIGIVVIIVLFIVFFGVINTAMTIKEDKLWNGGHCSICGGTWEYEQAVGHRSATSYIYVCSGCGKRIELNEVR